MVCLLTQTSLSNCDAVIVTHFILFVAYVSPYLESFSLLPVFQCIVLYAVSRAYEFRVKAACLLLTTLLHIVKSNTWYLAKTKLMKDYLLLFHTYDMCSVATSTFFQKALHASLSLLRRPVSPGFIGLDG